MIRPYNSQRQWALLLVAFGIVAIGVGAPGQSADALDPAYVQTRLGLTNPNALVAADLFGSPSPEIIITDVRGHIRLHDAITGEELRRFKIPGDDDSLTAPAVGDFFGEGSRDIAVGTGSGRLIVLRGSTLEILAERKVSSSFSLQPTVVRIPDATSPLGARDRVVLTDNDGAIRSYSLDEKMQITENWAEQTRTAVQAPVVAGRVRSAERLELVAATKDGSVVLIDALADQCANGRRPDGLPVVEPLIVRQMSQILVSPLLVDVNRDGRDEVFVAFAKGDLVGRSYQSNRSGGRWSDTFNVTARVRGTPVAPPTLIMKGTDPTKVRILQLGDSGISVFDSQTLATVAEDVAVFSGANTSLALIPVSGRFPAAAFGLKRTVTVTTNLDEWVETTGRPLGKREGTLEKSELQHSVVSVVGDDGVYIVGISGTDGGTLNGFKTPYLVGEDVWPNKVPWTTYGSTGLHNSKLDMEYAQHERKRREFAAQLAGKWRSEIDTLMSEGKWEEATDRAHRLASFDPGNEEYSSLKFKVFVRKNLVWLSAGGLAIILIIGYSAWVITNFVLFSRLRSRAESAFNRGEYDESRRLYLKLLEKAPKNPKIAIAVGRVLIAQRDYSEETLALYQRAHEALPGDQEILHSYARALLLEPKTTAEAGAVYEKTLPSFPEPQLLEYGLGRVSLAAGSYEEAGKRLRAALRGGVTSPALYRALCETYIQTRNFTAKALPVFEQQYPTRLDDRPFLEAYLLACIDGKKTDAQVESLCQAVLDLNPSFVPAYLHLASILLQKNQVGQAMEEVKSALKVDPADESAILLLAQCCLVQNRRDEEGLHAYRQALRLRPEDKDLLRMMTALFFERGVYDEEALEIYHRSVEVNPGDVTTLRALAQAAQLTGAYDLAIRAIEALANSGQITPKLNAQLADAYVKLRVIEPKAERVLRDALRQEPGNAEYLGALARVLAAQDRTDAECIPTYEAHLKNYRDDVQIGRQLAKSYIKADRYENALAVTQRFLKVAPQDDELQRLNALASLYDNKIDEAVSEYQRILQRNPNDPEALVNLALAYGQKLRVDEEATGLYTRGIALQPKNDRLQMAMARVHVSRNDLVKAVECYKVALKANTENPQSIIAHITALLNEYPDALRVRWFFVEVLVSLGYFREALEQLDLIGRNHAGQENNILRALESILAKDGNNLTALLMRGQMLLAANSLDDAARNLEKAYQLRPSEPIVIEKLSMAYSAIIEKKDSPEIRFKLGKLHFAQQDFDKAIGCFQRTAQDYRWEAESTKMLGKCFTNKGMLDLALQEYKKLVVDDETKELLYDLAQRYEAKRDLVGAKTVYRQLFAADINYKDVQSRFEMLSGSTSDPMAFEKTSIVQQMSEEAARRYELLDELGRGAMGIVYRARDKELEEVVALKILPDNMSNNPEAVRRFKIEARNARKLSHPHIVRIHDIGEEMGRKYISMEYVDGSDLKRQMKSAPNFKLPTDNVIKYAIQIADALAYAHRVGVVHRDIKPANIMLTSGDDVKVTDFGIAKLMDGGGEGTMIGAVIGTPLYMSPEQVQGIPVDNRADIYAYGIMMYELFNGRPPFTEGDLAYQHIHREPTPIEGLAPGLWDIVSKCLKKKKEDRWETAELIVEEFKRYRKSM